MSGCLGPGRVHVLVGLRGCILHNSPCTACTVQEDVTLDVDALWEALGEAGLSSEDADMLAASAYGAVELAWTLEELTQKEPRVSRLAATVRLLRAVVPGSESHLATAMQLQGLVTAQATQLLKAHARQRQRTTAAEKRLMAKVVAANQEAEGGLVAFLEAMYMRCVGRGHGLRRTVGDWLPEQSDRHASHQRTPNSSLLLPGMVSSQRRACCRSCSQPCSCFTLAWSRWRLGRVAAAGARTCCLMASPSP